MKVYSVAQVAEQLRLTSGRVTQCARRWGIGRKLNREWMFTAEDVAAIKKRRGMVGGAGHDTPRRNRPARPARKK